MNSLARVLTRATTSAGLAALGWSVVAQAQTPTVFNACVTPLTGLLYQPREPGKCFLTSHRAISWTDGARAILTGSTANGDLDGTYPDPKVDGLRGRLVADVAPTTNQILAWNGTAWTPKDPSGGGAIGTAGGDLTGTYPNPTIAADAITSAKIKDGEVKTGDLDQTPGAEAVTTATIRNQAVTGAKIADGSITELNLAGGAVTSAKVETAFLGSLVTKTEFGTYTNLLSNSGGTINAAGNPLSWTQLKDVPSGVISGGGASGIAGGDLSGTYPNPTVAKLQGTGLSSSAPTDKQVLTYDAATLRWAPATPSAVSGGTAPIYSVRSGSLVNPNFLRASCAPSETATGGGVRLPDGARGTLMSSYPITNSLTGRPDGWEAAYDFPAPGASIYVICVR